MGPVDSPATGPVEPASILSVDSCAIHTTSSRDLVEPSSESPVDSSSIHTTSSRDLVEPSSELPVDSSSIHTTSSRDLVEPSSESPVDSPSMHTNSSRTLRPLGETPVNHTPPRPAQSLQVVASGAPIARAVDSTSSDFVHSSIQTGLTNPSSSTDGTTSSKFWRPWSLQAPAIVAFIVLCIGLIAVLEAILQITENNGGGIFGIGEWVFKVVPTITTVLLGIYWSVIQNDISRLEPYYQLSRQGGATAYEALLVDYQRKLLFFVPFIAVRRKHWAVSISSCILMLITLGATPLTSAVFSSEEMTVSEIIPAQLATMIPFDKQADSVSAEFSYNAYEHIWNNRSLPPFVEDTFSLRPFSAPETVNQSRVAGDTTGLITYKYRTTKYSSSLNCVEPQQEITYNTTTNKPSSLFLTYGEDPDRCMYPLWAKLPEDFYGVDYPPLDDSAYTGPGWYNLDQQLLHRYPYNAILQDISPSDDNIRSVFGSIKPGADRFGVKNTTRICGLQGEFDFMAIFKTWEVTADDIAQEGALHGERAVQLLDTTYAAIDDLAIGIVSIPVWERVNATLEHPALRPGNFVAAFCRPNYWEEEVLAEVDGESKKVLNVESVGKARRPLKNVNTKLFKDILTGRHQDFTSAMGVWIPPPPVKEWYIQDNADQQSLNTVNLTMESGGFLIAEEKAMLPRFSSFTPFGMPVHTNEMRFSERFQANVSLATRLFNLVPRLQFNTQITPEQSLMPFVLANANVSSLTELGSFSKLENALNASYSMLFSYAMSNGSFLQTLSNAENADITRQTVTVATEVSVVFTRLTQAVLAIAGLLAMLLIYITHNRPLNTLEEPGAIIWHMKSIAGCSELVEELDGSESLSLDKLDRRYAKDQKKRYFLNPAHAGIEAVRLEGDRKPPRLPRKHTTNRLPNLGSIQQPKHAPPMELKRSLASFIIIGIAATCGIIGAAARYDMSRTGFNMPNKAAASIVLSYLPTILGMLLEAYIVMLAKFVSTIAPYDDMQRRKSSIATLHINYERIPPAFLWLKAMGYRHYLLILLSLSAILSNVLAVVFSGMFQQEAVFIYRDEKANSRVTLDGLTDNFNITAVEELMEMPYVILHDPHLDGFSAEDELEGATTRLDSFDLEPFISPYQSNARQILDLVYAAYQETSLHEARPWTRQHTFFFPLDVDFLWPGPNITNIRARTLGIKTQTTCSAVPNDQLIYGENFELSGRSADGGIINYPSLRKIRPGEGSCDGAILHHSHRFVEPLYPKNNTYYTVLQSSNRAGCRGNFFNLWEHHITSTSSDNFTNPVLIVSCSPKLHLSEYTVNFAPDGTIVSFHELDSLLYPNSNIPNITGSPSIENLQRLFQACLGPAPRTEAAYDWDDDSFHPSPSPVRWFPKLLEMHTPEIADSFPPDPDVAVAAIQEVYSSLFTTFLSSIHTVLLPQNPTAMKIKVEERQLRYRISIPLVYAAVSLMVILVVVVGAVMVRRPGEFMIQVPTNIIATMALLYAGRWVRVLRVKGWMDGTAGVKIGEGEEGVEFGYGWFVGADGYGHVGVDMEPVERGVVGIRRRRGWTWKRR